MERGKGVVGAVRAGCQGHSFCQKCIHYIRYIRYIRYIPVGVSCNEGNESTKAQTIPPGAIVPKSAGTPAKPRRASVSPAQAKPGQARRLPYGRLREFFLNARCD